MQHAGILGVMQSNVRRQLKLSYNFRSFENSKFHASMSRNGGCVKLYSISNVMTEPAQL
jgi:hypothetical protein